MKPVHNDLRNPRAALNGIAYAVAIMVGLAIATPVLAFDSGSSGADGVLNPAVSTEIVLPANGVLQYSSINIPAGVVVTFKKNVLNTPVTLLVSGNATIAGTINLNGGDAKNSGTYGGGNQADDGIPGVGGPGGFDGGRGGHDDTASRPDIISAGSGLGPGGGQGGNTRANGCYGGVYYHYIGRSASYADSGSTGYGYYGTNTYNCTNANPFLVAKPYGSAALVPLIGGSGGGGGNGGTNYPGTGGGGGGGAIMVAVSGTLLVSGVIDTTGGDAGGNAGTGAGQPGGGGSGGAIKLVATTFSGVGRIAAEGGCVNINNARRQECSQLTYGGSVGRIRIEAENITFNGTSVPAYSVDTPKPLSVANPPNLRITSIAGSNVPAVPTGSADLTFPANLTNPVTINFATTNVPTGNTIKLRVVPSYGEPIEVLSPALTGTTASGATSVSVNLPQGASVLQAITSYTVTVAQADSLSRFAQNERVERVELTASMGGKDTTAQLITASGKRFTVPVSVLQLAGING